MRRILSSDARKAEAFTIRSSVIRTISIFLLCALALIHLNLVDPGLQHVAAEDGNPPCPGGCPDDSLPPPSGSMSDEPTEVVPWYFSLLLLAL